MEGAGLFLPVLFCFFFSGQWFRMNLVAWGRYCGSG